MKKVKKIKKGATLAVATTELSSKHALPGEHLHLARLGDVVVDLPEVFHRGELGEALHIVAPVGI